jgi:polyhydroxyalkanoate synthase
MVDERVEALLDAHAEFETESVEAAEDVEELLGDGLEDLREQIAELTDSVAEGQGQLIPVEVERVGESLEDISGIGPTYAARLHEHGITTFDELAAASVETVAEAVDVPESRAASWIEAAKQTA